VARTVICPICLPAASTATKVCEFLWTSAPIRTTMVTASLEFEWGSNGRAGRRTHLSGAAARSYQVTPAGPSHPATAIRMQASPRTSGREPKSQSPDGKDPTTATSAAPTSLTLRESLRPSGHLQVHPHQAVVGGGERFLAGQLAAALAALGPVHAGGHDPQVPGRQDVVHAQVPGLGIIGEIGGVQSRVA